MKGQTFESYMEAVDAYIESVCGLTSEDIPDYHYYDNYLAGIEPENTGWEALQNAGFSEENE